MHFAFSLVVLLFMPAAADALVLQFEGEIFSITATPGTPQSVVDEFSEGATIIMSMDWDETAGPDLNPDPNIGSYGGAIRESVVEIVGGPSFQVISDAISGLAVINDEVAGTGGATITSDGLGWLALENGLDDTEVLSSLPDFNPTSASFFMTDIIEGSESPRMLDSDAIPAAPFLPETLAFLVTDPGGAGIALDIGPFRLIDGPAIRWDFVVEIGDISDPGGLTGLSAGELLSGSLFFDATLDGTPAGSDTTSFSDAIVALQMDVGDFFLSINRNATIVNTIRITDSDVGDGFLANAATSDGTEIELELLAQAISLDSQNLPATPLAALDVGEFLLEIGGFGGLARGTGEVSLEAEVVSIEVPEPTAWALLVVGMGVLGLAASRRHRRLNAKS